MELACEEAREPVKTVDAFIKAGDPGRKEAIDWLNDFIERILRELKDDFPKGISIDTFPRPDKLDYHSCGETRKQGIFSLANEKLEKELTDFALKEEGGIESILKNLGKRIDGKFDWALIDLADSYGAYHNLIKHYVSTKKGELPKQTIMDSILQGLRRIDELKKFDFDVSGFVGDIINKYKKMSPRVELSVEPLPMENDRKIYQITLKNLSVMPLIRARWAFDVKMKVWKDGKILEKDDRAHLFLIPVADRDFDKQWSWEHFTDTGDLAVRMDRIYENKRYLCVFKLALSNSGPTACQIKGRVFYEEPFLKGEKEISLEEEIKSDNY